MRLNYVTPHLEHILVTGGVVLDDVDAEEGADVVVKVQEAEHAPAFEHIVVVGVWWWLLVVCGVWW